jgi:glycosyltransferase involved in cell wall biosynthesis
MNPSRVQQRVFGDGYPAYVSTAETVVDRFVDLTRTAAAYGDASRAVCRIARDFTFDQAAARLTPVLRRGLPRQARGPITVLVAGHDLKFLRPVLSGLQKSDEVELLLDEYTGHAVADTSHRASLLERADVVFCEWCLGNAVWYSRHVREDQRLVVRLHLQERSLPYLDQVDWNRVDRLIFIAPEVMRECLSRKPELERLATLIYNPIACDDLDRPKLPGACFNLGLLGINPRRKRPDLAVEVLQCLRRRDSRYTLFVKSRSPWEYGWLWKQPEEREYYRAFYESVRRSPDADAVVFDAPGPDVAQWLSKIGWMLSVSDFEGSHQAVAEGMASGALPVIRDWPGASQMYPCRYGFHDVDDAVERIRELAPDYHRHQAACRRYARDHFDAPGITDRYTQLFRDLKEGDSGDGTTTHFGLHADAQLRAVPD